MSTIRNFTKWISNTKGHQIDIDRAYGDQCVDVILSYAQFLHPAHRWSEVVGTGNAKDLYKASNPKYWEKIPYKPGVYARRGDVVVWGSNPFNKYGHIAVALSRRPTNHQTVKVLEQDGFHPAGVAYTVRRPYNNVIGFLRPKGVKLI